MSMGYVVTNFATYVVFDRSFHYACRCTYCYKGNEDCVDIIASLPDMKSDETRSLSGEIGKYIVTARKKDVPTGFVGGMTNWDGRDVSVDFSFLDKGAVTMLRCFRDGVNADKECRGLCCGHNDHYERHKVEYPSRFGRRFRHATVS